MTRRPLLAIFILALAFSGCSKPGANNETANANATPPPALAPAAPAVDPAVAAEIASLEQRVTPDTAVATTLDEIKGLCQSSGLDVSKWERQNDEPELQTYTAARASLNCKASFADVNNLAKKLADFPKLAAVRTLSITRVDGEAGSPAGAHTQLQLNVRVLAKRAGAQAVDTPEAKLDLLRGYQRDQKSPVTTLTAVQGAMDDTVVLSSFQHESASLRVEGVADDKPAAEKFAKRIQTGALGIINNPDTQTSAITESEPDPADATKKISVERQKFVISSPLSATAKPPEDNKGNTGAEDKKEKGNDKKDKKDKKDKNPSP